MYYWYLANLLVLISCTFGYLHFKQRIPNGAHIPHPCEEHRMWYGVGHINSKGGGKRNVFGEDFARYGYKWSKCLCRLDSDNDGLTNGEELGDPHCEWSVGEEPHRKTHITHPGICEPIDSDLCRNTTAWLDCNSEAKFNCDATKEPDVHTITVKFPETNVPYRETSYMCMAFNISSQLPPGEFSYIANTPEIDNLQVMHHILVYGCEDDKAETVMQYYSSPKSCGMEAFYCPAIIGGWTLGNTGFCYDKNMGFTIGENGIKVVILQFHWNNPEMKSTYTDSSGVTIHYTPKKRPYEGGILYTGPLLLEIPPGHVKYSVTGGCSETCTSAMLQDKPVYLTKIIPHMHYLGTSFIFEHIRSGQPLMQYMLETYQYEDPLIHDFEPPIEVLPGDELRITCVYQSKTKNTFTFYGEGTSDEMCYGFLIYYPSFKTSGYCVTTGGYGFCGTDKVISPIPYSPGLCEQNDLLENLNEHLPEIEQNCDKTGLECWPNCYKSLNKLLVHPCLTGNTSEIVKRVHLTREMRLRMVSCDLKVAPIVGDPGFGLEAVYCADDKNQGISDGFEIRSTAFITLIGSMILLMKHI